MAKPSTLHDKSVYHYVPLKMATSVLDAEQYTYCKEQQH
jgi:hypothetical protein